MNQAVLTYGVKNASAVIF